MKNKEVKMKTEKLLPWNQFENIFRPICSRWEELPNGWIVIQFRNLVWDISNKKKNLFGNEIKVRRTDIINYTHLDSRNMPFHELWFERKVK